MKTSLMKQQVKNKYFVNTQKKFWINILYTVILFALAIISLILILTFNGKGFNFRLLSLIYKNLLIKIPVVAFCLGVSSYLIQHSSGNKMADTSILGLGNINSLFVIIMVTFLDLTSGQSMSIYNTLLPYVFIIGSICGSLLIYFLSYRKGKQISKKFILVGILVNFFFIGLSTAISSFLPSGKSALISQFTSGNLNATTGITYFWTCVIATAIIFVWIMIISNKFKIVSTNPVVAKSLGIDSNSITLQILIICGALTGIAYALVGNLVFLGLVTGNIATSMFKKNIRFGIFSTWFSSIIILALTFWIFTSIIPSALNNKLPTPLDTVNLISIMCIPYFIYLMFKE